MNKTTLSVFMFAAGAVTGSLATWKLLETKYKKIADEEIASVKEVFSRREEKTKTEDDTDSEEYDDEFYADIFAATDGDRVQYSQISSQYKSSIETKPERKEEGEVMAAPSVYVISPEEFADGDYVTKSLTYYADKVLTDEIDNVIEDIDDLIRAESLNHFGEYEDDSVFVRNEELMTDFEILLDVRNYSDVIGNDSHSVSDE